MPLLERFPLLKSLLPKVAVLPDDVRAELVADSLLLIDERLNGMITFTDPPARGRRPVVRKVGIRGAIAVTHHRVLVWVQMGAYVEHPRQRAPSVSLEVTHDRGRLLCVAFDAKILDKKEVGPGSTCACGRRTRACTSSCSRARAPTDRQHRHRTDLPRPTSPDRPAPADQSRASRKPATAYATAPMPTGAQTRARFHPLPNHGSCIAVINGRKGVMPPTTEGVSATAT